MANMMTGTSGRSRFSSPMINAASAPSPLRSTASTLCRLNSKTPSYPLPELRTFQPCFLKFEQRRFKLTASFPIQRTSLRCRVVTVTPYSPGLRCALSVGRRSRFMITRIAVRVDDRNHVWPKRVSSGPSSGPATRPFCSRPRPPIDFVTGKRGFPALKSLPHARVAHCRRLFPQRLSSV